MPNTITISAPLASLIAGQDGVVGRLQLAEHGIGRGPISHRVQQGRWRWLLPGVVLTQSGYPTRRQRLVAAWLWGGPGCAIDGASACYWYGVGDAPTKVHLVVPWDSPARSRGYVIVRRSLAPIVVGARSAVPYVEPAMALIVAARSCSSERAAIALLSRGLQTGLVDERTLRDARERLGDKWCRRTDAALLAVGVGVRSAAELDAHRLIASSRLLPPPLLNQWLDLGDGGAPVCADALWTDAGLVHETNGKRYHAWDLAFDDMQARHDRLTTAGLIALHNSPTRIRRDGPEILREIERTYVRYRDRGMPAGTRLVDPPARDNRA